MRYTCDSAIIILIYYHTLISMILYLLQITLLELSEVTELSGE